ncbi:uncharacterized protein LOC108193484 isoform X2 [Daucus carota subsp. sativus]|uniref:uncharacterized protein LOC108193484 isoform X2 n=1 Tax=Daucus carota subsp. sativus TaxID=79200 RepID=UPI00308313D0
MALIKCSLICPKEKNGWDSSEFRGTNQLRILFRQLNMFRSRHFSLMAIAGWRTVDWKLIMDKVTLPDGTVKEGKKWMSTPFDIATGISKSLGSNSLISQVNGVLWDMSRPLEGETMYFINLDVAVS